VAIDFSVKTGDMEAPDLNRREHYRALSRRRLTKVAADDPEILDVYGNGHKPKIGGPAARASLVGLLRGHDLATILRPQRTFVPAEIDRTPRPLPDQ
jgi:hypothetical protein